jgi:hypothetical protein
MLLVAVDIGRSSVKVAYGSEKRSVEFFQFPSIVSTEHSKFSDVNNSFFSAVKAENLLEIKIPSGKSLNGWTDQALANRFLFGKMAELQGERVIQFTEGKSYHFYSIACCLAVVAKLVRQLGESEISLAINTTYFNANYVPLYDKHLVGHHAVEFAVLKDGRTGYVPVSFDIVSLDRYTQGYSSIWSFVNNKDVSEYVDNTIGVVVDIGRYSTDFSFVKEFVLERGHTVNIGTNKIVTRLIQEASKEKLGLTPQDIDKAFLNPSIEYRTASSVKPFKPYEVAQSLNLFEDLYQEIYRAFLSFVGQEANDSGTVQLRRA